MYVLKREVSLVCKGQEQVSKLWFLIFKGASQSKPNISVHPPAEKDSSTCIRLIDLYTQYL